MLKEVGASGQISLGKKYAGKLFDVILHPCDRFELIPVRVVATAPPQTPQIVQAPDGWMPPDGHDGCVDVQLAVPAGLLGQQVGCQRVTR